MIRIACIDDHPLFLRGLAAAAHATADDVAVVASGAGTDAVVGDLDVDVDVVLLDLVMPRPPKQSVATDVQRWRERGAAVLICTSEDKPVPLRRALAAGASGLVLKTDEPEHVMAAVRTVHSGEVAYSGEVAHALATDPELVTRLSPREVEVLRLVASGATQRIAARRLGISERAVKEYLARALARFRDQQVEPGNAHGVISLARAEGHLDA